MPCFGSCPRALFTQFLSLALSKDASLWHHPSCSQPCHATGILICKAWLFFRRQLRVAQPGLGFSVCLRMTLQLLVLLPLSQELGLGMSYHTWFVQCLGLNPGFCACLLSFLSTEPQPQPSSVQSVHVRRNRPSQPSSKKSILTAERQR